MKIHAVNVFSGEAVEIRGSNVIEGVDDLIAPPAGLPFVAPGFIDLQVNGYAGVDYCAPDASEERIAASLEAQFATGVTRLLPTVITGAAERMLTALRNLAEARERLEFGAAMEGFHVEGPHISPDDGPRGAHPRASVRPPDIEEYKRWQGAARGNVKMITLAPEWPGAARYIEHIVSDGVAAAIGHAAASGEQIHDAVAAGATLSTHLGNGSHAVLARHPNYIWSQLAADGLAASFIADGIHLDAATLKSMVRAKGVDRSVLVTDAVMPAGCAPGAYTLGEVDVELRDDGSVRLRGGNQLAGSALRMDAAVGNAVRLAGVSLREAITMTTINPARVGRLAGRLRGLRPGERADLVVFEFAEGRMKVLETYVGGRRA